MGSWDRDGRALKVRDFKFALKIGDAHLNGMYRIVRVVSLGRTIDVLAGAQGNHEKSPTWATGSSLDTSNSSRIGASPEGEQLVSVEGCIGRDIKLTMNGFECLH